MSLRGEIKLTYIPLNLNFTNYRVIYEEISDQMTILETRYSNLRGGGEGGGGGELFECSKGSISKTTPRPSFDIRLLTGTQFSGL